MPNGADPLALSTGRSADLPITPHYPPIAVSLPAATSPPAEPSRLREFLPILIAGLGDILGAIGGQPAQALPTTLALQGAQQQARAAQQKELNDAQRLLLEHRRVKAEEARVVLEQHKTLSGMSQQGVALFKGMVGTYLDAIKANPLMSEKDRADLAEEFSQQATGLGGSISADVFKRLGSDAGFLQMFPTIAPLLDTGEELAAAVSTLRGGLATGKSPSEAILPVARAAGVVELSRAVNEYVAAKPTAPTLTGLLGWLRTAKGPVGGSLASMLEGSLGPEVRDTLMKVVETQSEITLPEEARRIGQAVALETAKDPFFHERKLLEHRRLVAEVAEGDVKSLPADVRAELKADPTIKGPPTSADIDRAIARVDKRLTERAVESARQQGLLAAAVPQRTPAESLKQLETIALARGQMTELTRLVDEVNLNQLVGGIRPWVNEIIQTGRVGPIPLPEAITGKLTPADERFLALLLDYADSVLRLRSGANINEQEFQRMMNFLAQPGLRPQTLKTRLQLQHDLLEARESVMRTGLEGAGFRAPVIAPPRIGGPERTKEQPGAPAGTADERARQKFLLPKLKFLPPTPERP